MITICVFDKSSGRPLPGRRVQITFNSSFVDGFVKGYTNINGCCDFDAKPNKGIIYVDDKYNVYEGYISGRINVYC